MREEAHNYDFGDVIVGTQKIHKIVVCNETSVSVSFLHSPYIRIIYK